MRMPDIVWSAFKSSDKISAAPALIAEATISASQNPILDPSSILKAVKNSAGLMSMHHPAIVLNDRSRGCFRHRRRNLTGHVHMEFQRSRRIPRARKCLIACVDIVSIDQDNGVHENLIAHVDLPEAQSRRRDETLIEKRESTSPGPARSFPHPLPSIQLLGTAGR